jgi:hypothetical protein
MKSVRTVNGVTWIDDAVQKSEQLNDKLLEILHAYQFAFDVVKFFFWSFNLKPVKQVDFKIRQNSFYKRITVRIKNLN